jgi:hypothetical protein
MTDLRYPIGPFQAPASITAQDLHSSIDAIAALPSQIRASLAGLDEQQIDTAYRPGGWTVRQVVHHVADSHMHSYIRMRLGLTENSPDILAYNEKFWAELVDARHAAPDVSVTLIDALHRRWTMLLRGLTEADWKKTFRHPERGMVRLDVNTLLYAWHGKHHVAHIMSLRQRMLW